MLGCYRIGLVPEPVRRRFGLDAVGTRQDWGEPGAGEGAGETEAARASCRLSVLRNQIDLSPRPPGGVRVRKLPLPDDDGHWVLLTSGRDTFERTGTPL